MILQALNHYYDRLVEAGKLERLGWQPVKVSYALQINDMGQIVRVLPLLHEEERGKKKVWVPQTINVTAQETRAVGIISNFLCDNTSYILGVDQKGKPDRSIKCFQACRERHIGLLKDVDSKPAKAVVRFFQNWEPEKAVDDEALKLYLDDMLMGANLIFDYQYNYVHEDYSIQKKWDDYYASSADEVKMHCLVTGEYGTVARLHLPIKGAGGQPSGTSLVSFNAPAFESFGRDGGQGYNAPVSKKAAFAYGTALNYMLAQQGHHLSIGDTAIVFWSESGEDGYTDIFFRVMGEDKGLDEQEIYDCLKNLAAGLPANINKFELNPNEHFYILGLSPNAARLSVRFFLENSFGQFVNNLLKHQNRLNIIKPTYDTRNALSFWQLLNETVNQKSRDKTPSPILSGALVRSVLMDEIYPRLLLDQTEIRIRAEREVKRAKAAIIKAYLLKMVEMGKLSKECEEALRMDLNEKATYQPYLLGRLFSILEGLQLTANPGINATIRDRYFNSACSTPAVIFPQLIKLAQAHLRKVGGGLERQYSKQIGDIMANMEESYPNRLSLYDQGIFQIGYYHQTQARYTKKEDKENE